MFPSSFTRSRSRLGRNEQATARVQDRKVVANEVVAMLLNARRITEMSPDSSFALPGTLSQHAMGVHFGPAGLARLDDNKRRENETAVVKASRETGEDVHKSRTLDIAILNVCSWGLSRSFGGMYQTSESSQQQKLAEASEPGILRNIVITTDQYLQIVNG
jgi:hypothetical protein